MFPGAGAAKPVNWNELHFHQKLKHLSDTAADYVFSKQAWWLPCIAVASAAAVTMFSGPMAVPQLMSLVAQIGTPVPSTSVFGQEMPQQPPAPEGADDDEDM